MDTLAIIIIKFDNKRNFKSFREEINENSKQKNNIPHDRNKKKNDNKTEDSDVQSFRARQLDNEIFNIDQIAYIMVFVYNIMNLFVCVHKVAWFLFYF